MTKKDKLNRRDQILTTALDLFNASGTQNVTTNHIADALGISPGNLYYHFKNKEHIIRDLLRRLIEGFDNLLAFEENERNRMDVLAETFFTVSDLIYRYRFIFIELAALLNRDEHFKIQYQEVKARRMRQFVGLFDAISAQGVLRCTVTRDERDALMLVAWTYVEGIVTALHTGGIAADRKNISDYLKKSLFLFKPYLHPPIWAALCRAMTLENDC